MKIVVRAWVTPEVGLSYWTSVTIDLGPGDSLRLTSDGAPVVVVERVERWWDWPYIIARGLWRALLSEGEKGEPTKLS